MGEYLFLCNANDEKMVNGVFDDFKMHYERYYADIPCTRFNKSGLEVIRDIICADLRYMMGNGCDNCQYRHHMSSEDYTARAMLKEYCERNCVDAYFYQQDMRPSLQGNLESFCKRLKCDVSKVQPAYDALMEHIKHFKHINKNPHRYNRWSTYMKYMRQDKAVKAYDDFIGSLVANSEWGYMYTLTYLGWSTDTWENENECIADELLKEFSKQTWTGDSDLIEIRSDDDDDF